MPTPTSSTGLSITNPLVRYRSLLAKKSIDPDPGQHRLALHLQTLYNRLKDYEPIVHYGYRLQQLHQTLGSTPANPAPGTNHDAPRHGILASLFAEKKDDTSKASLALTKVLTSHEAALQMDSPKGLLLHGGVGTGKSMLIDLFADCLPNRKKRRWHYNTFMLDILAKLERLRKSRELIIPASLGQQDDYSLLWLAREMISTSPILFLDEFQTPDRAAAKILTNLMTCFFQLGGVLIATSNRMPEELDKAAGMQFAPPPSPGRFHRLRWSFGESGVERKRSEFADFLDVLRARCDVWQMEGHEDYRRREPARESQDGSVVNDETSPASDFHGLEPMSTGNVGLGWEQSKASPAVTDEFSPSPSLNRLASTTCPKFYHLNTTTTASEAIPSLLRHPNDVPIPWAPQTLSVYSRRLYIPRTYNGTALFTFDELCTAAHGPTSALGPADYISIASHFHTLVLTDVPILTTLQRNEARRLITLLDALHEARCKLAIFADAGPDGIFFPDATTSRRPGKEAEDGKGVVEDDATYSETISEIYQDTTAPFRPNVSTYGHDSPGAAPPEEADATHARFAGLFDESRQRELSAQHYASSVDVGDARLIAQRRIATAGSDTTANMSADTESGAASIAARAQGPNFSMGGAFTGEDEKFAFKRARSRLWELCSTRWWAREHIPTPEDGEMTKHGPVSRPSWWQPLSPEIRVWERPSPEAFSSGAVNDRREGETVPYATASLGEASETRENVDAGLFTYGATSPFRTSADPPPKFSWTHVWGMMKWGKKAGRWGQGADAFGASTSEDYIKRTNAWRKKADDGTTGRT